MELSSYCVICNGRSFITTIDGQQPSEETNPTDVVRKNDGTQASLSKMIQSGDESSRGAVDRTDYRFIYDEQVQSVVANQLNGPMKSRPGVTTKFNR
jgi:hypothetical protein